jgi:hypothetical protein
LFGGQDLAVAGKADADVLADLADDSAESLVTDAAVDDNADDAADMAAGDVADAGTDANAEASGADDAAPKELSSASDSKNWCTPGEKLCAPPDPGSETSTTVLQCDSKGADTDVVETCKKPKACFAGACRVCDPGATRCNTSGVRETCDGEGSGWTVTPCQPLQPACVAGQCLPCLPNQLFCGPAAPDGTPSPKVLLCNATGTQASLQKMCASSLVCTNGTCGVCAAKSSACLHGAVLTCAVDGSGWAKVTDCAAAGVGCNKGVCGCMAGAASCAPPVAGTLASMAATTCAADGKSATVAAACKVGEACVGGACAGCLAGDKRCQGGKALQCKPDGSGFQVAGDCAANSTICAGGKCLDVCNANLANPTHWGCEFWSAPLGNVAQPGSKPTLALLLANADPSKAATVTVTQGGSKIASANVPAGGSATVALASVQPADGSGSSFQAVRITSDHAVAVSQWNPADGSSGSAGASLLLPANAIGNSYRVLARGTTAADLHGLVAVVAARPGATLVTVTATAAVAAGGGVAAMKAGDAVQVPLGQGQMLQLASAGAGSDFTGTQVVADKPVAVFAGAVAVHVPDTTACVLPNKPGAPGGSGGQCAGSGKVCFGPGECPQACCADHIEEQLPPVASWGTVHAVPTLEPRVAGVPEVTQVRIVADSDHTTVALLPTGVTPVTLAAGGWFEVETKTALTVLSSKPVLVAQFLRSSQLVAGGPGDIGDPAMHVVPPVARWAAESRFSAPSSWPSMFLHVAALPGTNATLDGSALKLEPAAGLPWLFARVSVGAGAHHVAANQALTAWLVGWGKGAAFSVPVLVGAP